MTTQRDQPAPRAAAAAAAAGTESARPRQVRLAWAPSAHAQRLVTLALAGLIIAVVTRRPEFAGVAAPAVLLLAARRRKRPGQIGLGVHTSSSRLTEGQDAELDVTVTGPDGHSVDLIMHPRHAVVPAAGQAGRAGPGRLADGETSLPFQVTRSGRRNLGVLGITLRDRLRLTEGQARVELPAVDCYPRPAAQRSRVVLSRLPSRLGEHPSRSAGEGLEFTGVREFVPGDRQRRINWPATTRLGRMQLNTFAAERTQNVVLIADASSEVGEPGSTPSDLALRGCAAAARAYLAVRDRVGLVVYQNGVRWISPGAGTRQYYRIMDLMVAGRGVSGPLARAGGLARLPRAALPPGALILVFTPLLDRRLIETLRDLRERGFSVLIVDVLNAEPTGSSDSLSGLARRIWRMEQEAIRFSLRELGIPLVHWDGEQSLDEPLAPYTRRVTVSHR
ncbi:MAG TPA: DUF58 domain-containing protein [Streptosporangiaceae bacterium]|nr:DUF58 domain-containing protein [Streptosporangiaceae bacterium]